MLELFLSAPLRLHVRRGVLLRFGFLVMLISGRGLLHGCDSLIRDGHPSQSKPRPLERAVFIEDDLAAGIGSLTDLSLLQDIHLGDPNISGG